MSIWGLDPIPVRAATDRMPLDSALNAGGYSERRDFFALMASGNFRAELSNPTRGIMAVLRNSAGAGQNGCQMEFTQAGVANWAIGQPAGQNAFAIFSGRSDGLDGIEVARWAGNGNFGVGVSPVVRLHAKSSGEIARLETTDARGSGNCYQTFRDPAGEKGYIGFVGGDNMAVMSLLGGVLRLGTNGAFRVVVDGTGQVYPGADNAQGFGFGGARWSTIFAATGTINTSDEREKNWREMLGVGVALFAPNLYDAELRAGLRAIEELGFFQWNDAIELKGPEEARWHFGPRAQLVWAIFAEEDMCPALIQREPGGDWLPPEGSIPPAFLCFDEWGEETAPVMAWWKPSAILGLDGEPVMVPCEEGEEGTEQRPTGETYVTRPAGNRFGVRIDQLHSLMIAALNAERLAQAATIADLTARIVALEPAA